MTNAGIVVLGLGNVILSDDGLGVRAAECVRSDKRLPNDVAVVDGGTMGLELLSVAAGAGHLLVLDAIDLGMSAGTLVRVDSNSLGQLPGSASVHSIGLADLLAAMRMMGEAPGEVVLLGVQPGVTSLGTTLSPEVEQTLDRLVESALNQIAIWTVVEEKELESCTK